VQTYDFGLFLNTRHLHDVHYSLHQGSNSVIEKSTIIKKSEALNVKTLRAARSSNLHGGHDKDECERISNTTSFEVLCSNRPAVLRQDDGAAQQDDGGAPSQAYRTGALRAPRRSCRRHGLRALTRQQTEQRELLERYNRLVHLDQLMESKIQELRYDQLIQLKMQEAENQMTSSGETEGPVITTNMPAMPDDA